MANWLLFGDAHIKKSELSELEAIFEEILAIAVANEITHIGILGDTFDRCNPCPEEIDFFSNWINKFDIPIILIAANSHESITKEVSYLNHFGILKDNITICKEWHDNRMFLGHFSLQESSKNFDAKLSKKDFTQYKYVWLGHIHSPQIIPKNICHLGSIRYIDFGEVLDPNKTVVVIDNYNEEGEEVRFIALKTPYKMIDIVFGKSGVCKSTKNLIHIQVLPKLVETLDLLDSTDKIRINFQDFESWKSFINIQEKYEKKFFLFRTKKDFITNNEAIVSAKKTVTIQESLKAFLLGNKVNKEVQAILLKEIE